MNPEDIPRELFDLINKTVEWITGKIEGGEGFSFLAMTKHEDGLRMTNIAFPTADEAWQALKEDFAEIDTEVFAYAVCCDASVFLENGEEQRVIICRAEQVGMEKSCEFYKLYKFSDPEKGFGTPIKVEDNYLLRGMGDKLLPR